MNFLKEYERKFDVWFIISLSSGMIMLKWHFLGGGSERDFIFNCYQTATLINTM